MRLSAKKRQTVKKPPENKGRLRDNRSSTEPSGSSKCDHESQVAKNKGDDEHRLGAGSVCKTFCRPT
jgi:hypothetical protein